jgi:hypothetical protein
MDNLLDQLANNIKQAYKNDGNGLSRLHLIMAIVLSEELSTELCRCLLSLESIGEQLHEVFNFRLQSNIDSHILDL